MLALIRYCAVKLQIKHFFVDSLMKCGVKQTTTTRNRHSFLRCATSAATLGFTSTWLLTEKQLDESARQPGKMDIRGSGTIGDLVFNIITIWRNKPKENGTASGDCSKDLEHDQILICDKQRNGDWEGKLACGITKSGQYLEEYDCAPCDLTENLP